MAWYYTKLQYLWITQSSVIFKWSKNGKAAGVNALMFEQSKHLGPLAMTWFLERFNNRSESVG